MWSGALGSVVLQTSGMKEAVIERGKKKKCSKNLTRENAQEKLRKRCA